MRLFVYFFSLSDAGCSAPSVFFKEEGMPTRPTPLDWIPILFNYPWAISVTHSDFISYPRSTCPTWVSGDASSRFAAGKAFYSQPAFLPRSPCFALRIFSAHPRVAFPFLFSCLLFRAFYFLFCQKLSFCVRAALCVVHLEA